MRKGSEDSEEVKTDLLNNLFIHTFVKFGSMVGNWLIFLIELYAGECSPTHRFFISGSKCSELIVRGLHHRHLKNLR